MKEKKYIYFYANAAELEIMIIYIYIFIYKYVFIFPDSEVKLQTHEFEVCFGYRIQTNLTHNWEMKHLL